LSPLRRSSWRSVSFMVVDVETTGLDPRRDELISFAALPVEGGRVLAGAAVGGLVRPRKPPPSSSVEIHGLRAGDLAAAPPPAEALGPLAAALRTRVLVAHAAWVERSFLDPVLRELGSGLPRRLVDTALLWRMLCVEREEGDPGWCSLATVAAGLGLPSHRPHEAEGDALTTAQAFLALATHLEARGRGTLRALTGADAYMRNWRQWHPPAARP
jgi:DNA polymerase III subunit epsilon